MNFSQRNRLMNITSTALAEDTFLLTGLEGVEAISSPFEYKLTLIYQGNGEFNAQTLLGKMVTVTIHSSVESSRIINGYVSSIEGGELNAQGLRHYYFTVVPAFWYLRFVKNSHRFENKSVVDIFKEVCQSAGFQAFSTSGLTESYPSLEYEIQYNETAFDFLSRILGEAGIYYYFTHTAQAHTMVLTDKFTVSTSGITIPYSNADNMDVHIHSWKQRSVSHINELSSQSYQEKTPNTDLLVQVKAKKQSEILGQSDFEHFYYSGKYTDKTTGKALLQGQLSRFLSKKQVLIGEGNSPQVIAGSVFTLQAHPNTTENQAYIILQVQHYAHDNTYLHHDENHVDKLSQGYHNEFFCIPANAEQTPAIAYSPVTVAGVQSAKADGNTLAKINADKGGHVKAQFFWQQDDDMKLSTHAIRVLQPVAGKNWGMQFMPHQGDEMVMGYLYGDVRQPIVLGSLYNAKQLPFYPLPNAQNKTGIVTMSVGDSSIKHQLTFDDTKGNEILTFASGKDMMLSAKKDFTINIAHDLTYTVKGNVDRKIGKEQIIKAKQSMTLKAGSSSITISPDKISIQAMKVTAEAGGGGGSGSGSSPTNTVNSGTSSPPIATPSQCQLPLFEVGCTHSGRGFPVNPISGKPTTEDGRYVLQVIADDKTGDRILVQWKGKAASCPSHNSGTTSFTVIGPATQLGPYTSNEAFYVKSAANDSIARDFGGFFESILIPNSSPATYEIIPDSCDSKAQPVTIEAFAPVEWDGSVSVEFKHNTQQDSNFNQQQGWKKLKVNGEWDFAGEINVTRNSTSWSLDGSNKMSGGHYKNNKIHETLFGQTQSFLNHILPFFGSLKSKYGNINIGWPKLILGGKVKNIESSTDASVSTQGNIKISFDPFINVDIDMDVINWLIMIAGDGVFGNYLVDIKEQLAQGVSVGEASVQAQLQALLTVGADIAGDLEWNKPAMTWSSGGQISGELPISLIGNVSGSIDVFILKAMAGATISLSSGVSVSLIAGTIEDESSMMHYPSLTPKFDFKGLTVYWSAFYKVVVKTKQSTEHAKGRLPPSDENSDTNKPVAEKRYENQFVILEPKSWSNDSKPITINRFNDSDGGSDND